MVTVGVAGLFEQNDLLGVEGALFFEAQGVVVGDQQGLPGVAAGFFPEVEGEVLFLDGLFFAGAVGAAVEEVPAHHQFGDVVVAVAGGTEVVVGLVGAGTEVEAGGVGGAPGVDFVLGGFDVFGGGEQRRVLLVQGVEGGFGLAGEGAADRAGGGDGGDGLAADEALVAGADVVEVGGFSDQVDFGQRQAAAGLFEVDAAADAALGAFFDLVVGGFVLDVVVFGEVDELAVAQDVEGGAAGFEGDAFGGVEEFVVADELGFVEAADFVPRREAVEDHLVEAEQDAAAGVVVAGADRGLFEAFAAAAGGQVHAREVAAAGYPDFFVGRPVGVPLRGHFRTVQDGALGDFFQGGGGGSLLGKGRQGGKDEQNTGFVVHRQSQSGAGRPFACNKRMNDEGAGSFAAMHYKYRPAPICKKR